jgi:hypothetical protein
MSNVKKHIGVLRSSGAKIILVFRFLPEEPTSCLVIEQGRLPDAYASATWRAVDSKEGQLTNDLYEVLNKNIYPDGGNMLHVLHANGLLRKVAVSDVVLTLTPTHQLALEVLNSTIASKATDPAKVDSLFVEPVADTKPTDVSLEAQAKQLLIEAEAMMCAARGKREAAYVLCPAFRPNSRASTVKGGRQPNDVVTNKAQKARVKKTYVKKVSAKKKEAKIVKED